MKKNRIIPEEFGRTGMGRDLLAQDYILKQLTASLLYPKEELGHEFWKRVYAKAREVYGVHEIPVKTLNRVWVLPEEAIVYQKGTTAFILESKLKVMLEEDYLGLRSEMNNDSMVKDSLEKQRAKGFSSPNSEFIREVIIPEVEREVNEGGNFSKLRQIYHSLILAKWYKENLKSSILSSEYANQKKIAGVDVDDKQIKEKIYNQYLDAFKKGAFKLIKEDYDPISKEIVAVKYLSGGFRFTVPLQVTLEPTELAESSSSGKLQWIRGVYVEPRVSARYINDLFGQAVRDGRGEPIESIFYEGVETATYGIDVSLREAGQFGHIGLGEKEIKDGKVIYKEGGDVVVYLLKEVANNLQVRNHEGLKAQRIREKMKSLGEEQKLDRSLSPAEMRRWTKDNVNGLAGEFLREIDQEAERRYPLKSLYQEAKKEGRLPSDTFIAQTYLQAEDFVDLNFAGGRTRDVDENFTEDEILSFKRSIKKISSIYQKIEILMEEDKKLKGKEYQKEIASLLSPLRRNGKLLFPKKTSEVISGRKKLSEVLNFFLELASMRGENNTFLFSAYNLIRITKNYHPGEESEIMRLVSELQQVNNEEGNPLLKRLHIVRIIERREYFDKEKFNMLKEIFQEVKINTNSLLLWVLYQNEYFDLLKSWMHKPFDGLTPLEKKRRGELFSFFSSKLEEKHIIKLAEIYLSQEEFIEFSQYVKQEVVEDRKRLIKLLENNLDSQQRDVLLKRLMMSYNRNIRNQTIGEIYRMLSDDILEVFNRHAESGGDIVAKYLASYPWNNPESGLDDLRRKLAKENGPTPKWGFSGNKVDWRFTEAQNALLLGDYILGNRLVAEAIDLLATVDFEELDLSGFPVADRINQMEVAKWTLHELFQENIASKNAQVLLKLLKDGKNGLELKQALIAEIKNLQPLELNNGIENHILTRAPKKSDEKNLGGINFNLDLFRLGILGKEMDLNISWMRKNSKNIRIDEGLLPIVLTVTPFVMNDVLMHNY